MSFLVFYFFLVLASLKLVVPVPCGVLDIVYLCIKYNQNIMKSLHKRTTNIAEKLYFTFTLFHGS